VAVPDINYARAWNDFSLTPRSSVPKQKYPYQHCFEASAKKYDVPLSFLLALARGESDFNPNARSSANAYGLMQIVWPGTANYLGINSLSELKKPCVNVDAGTRYIKKQIKRFKGDMHLALAAYNYGPHRIAKNTANIPKGANWYSGYIYQHLQYVLGSSHPLASFAPPVNYSDEHKLRITTFTRRYRASAFITAISKRAPNVRLDSFDSGFGRYHVVLLYGSQKELNASKQALAKVGFVL
jgi:soluble lytic murein transglycosylase-like protein